MIIAKVAKKIIWVIIKTKQHSSLLQHSCSRLWINTIQSSNQPAAFHNEREKEEAGCLKCSNDTASAVFPKDGMLFNNV